MGWFHKLFSLCEHEWNHLDSVDVPYNCHTQMKRVYVSQCVKCGKFKKVTVK